MAEAFDRLNTDNDADAWKKEVKLKFDPHDALYWFNAVEADMKRFGINKQWDKKNSIVPLLPSDVVEELKPFLRLTEDEAGNTIYYDVKQELLSLYGPKEEDAYQKAKSLKLTTTPSALGKKLVHAVCPGAKPFDTCHCARMVYGFWIDQMSPPIRSALAGEKFNKDRYKAIFKKADDMWRANGGSVRPPAVVAAVTSVVHDQAEFPPQVSAVRGQGRGQAWISPAVSGV